MKTVPFAIIFGILTGLTACTDGVVDVNFSVMPDSQNHTISSLIYGTNQDLVGGENFSFRRLGGNRLTSYNWENNASNSGKDWFHSSDNYLSSIFGITGSDRDVPGMVLTAFQDQAVADGARSLITLQMAGYVAKDKNGSVTDIEAAPSNRWVQALPKKNAPFSLSPDVNDAAVYIDESVNFLVNRYGSAANGGVMAYALDNEPALWSDTHPRIHSSLVGAQEVVNLSIALAKAVKDIDSTADIYGPALYGFAAYNNFQGAPDWQPTLAGQYEWFVDFYLAQMKIASEEQGRRLLDVLDVHWYPEATGDERIISDTANSRNDQIERLQAPRTLWDPDYLESSWIAQSFATRLPLIPQLQASISNHYPGTKLAMTEFNYGGDNDITGGVALADVLGIFGKYNLYAANFWKLSEQNDYSSLAYKLYRNYDGSNASFGDISVDATMSDKENSSIYAAVDSSGDLHVVVLNKNLDEVINGSFTIDSNTVEYQLAIVYSMDQSAQSIQNSGSIAVSNNAFSYTLPPVSAHHIVLTTTAPASSSSSSSSSNSSSSGSLTPPHTSTGGSGSLGMFTVLLLLTFFFDKLSDGLYAFVLEMCSNHPGCLKDKGLSLDLYYLMIKSRIQDALKQVGFISFVIRGGLRC